MPSGPYVAADLVRLLRARFIAPCAGSMALAPRLMAEVLAGSDEFARPWSTGAIPAGDTLCETFQHRLVGAITVNSDALEITQPRQLVIIYTADPGSPSEQALRILAVVGTQPIDAIT